MATGDRLLDSRKAIIALYGRATLVQHLSMTATTVQVSSQLEENGLYLIQSTVEANVRYQTTNSAASASTTRNEGVLIPAGGTLKTFLKNDTRYLGLVTQSNGEMWIFKLD